MCLSKIQMGVFGVRCSRPPEPTWMRYAMDASMAMGYMINGIDNPRTPSPSIIIHQSALS